MFSVPWFKHSLSRQDETFTYGQGALLSLQASDLELSLISLKKKMSFPLSYLLSSKDLNASGHSGQ